MLIMQIQGKSMSCLFYYIVNGNREYEKIFFHFFEDYSLPSLIRDRFAHGHLPGIYVTSFLWLVGILLFLLPVFYSGRNNHNPLFTILHCFSCGWERDLIGDYFLVPFKSKPASVYLQGVRQQVWCVHICPPSESLAHGLYHHCCPLMLADRLGPLSQPGS